MGSDTELHVKSRHVRTIRSLGSVVDSDSNTSASCNIPASVLDAEDYAGGRAALVSASLTRTVRSVSFPRRAKTVVSARSALPKPSHAAKSKASG